MTRFSIMTLLQGTRRVTSFNDENCISKNRSAQPKERRTQISFLKLPTSLTDVDLPSDSQNSASLGLKNVHSYLLMLMQEQRCSEGRWKRAAVWGYLSYKPTSVNLPRSAAIRRVYCPNVAQAVQKTAVRNQQRVTTRHSLGHGYRFGDTLLRNSALKPVCSRRWYPPTRPHGVILQNTNCRKLLPNDPLLYRFRTSYLFRGRY